MENTLAYNIEDDFLYKSNSLVINEGSPLHLLERLKLHNALFVEAAYELVGFTGLDHGAARTPTIHVVLRQAYVTDARQATSTEIDEHMNHMGYEKIDEGAYQRAGYIIDDLSPRNALFKDGGVFVIDPYILPDPDGLSAELTNSAVETAATWRGISTPAAFGRIVTSFEKNAYQEGCEGRLLKVLAVQRRMSFEEVQDQQRLNSKD